MQEKKEDNQENDQKATYTRQRQLAYVLASYAVPHSMMSGRGIFNTSFFPIKTVVSNGNPVNSIRSPETTFFLPSP